MKNPTRNLWLVALCVALVNCATSSSERERQGLAAPAAAIEQHVPDVNQSGPFAGHIETIAVGKLEDRRITELSGFAASRRHPGVFYAINDSGNHPQLFAVGADGRALARWRLAIDNIDWEDVATFEHRGRTWLMIADVGDNRRSRKSYQLHFFDEPQTLTQQHLDLDRSHRFGYEDGAQNVESVAVSESDQAVYLIGKTARRPALYTLPLEQTYQALGVAQRLGEIDSLRKTPTDSFFEMLLAGRILLAPTAMDISADDRLAIVANYRHVYLYTRAESQSWPQALTSTRPRVISSHRLRQSEALSFAVDGQSIVLGSEGRHAPVLHIRSRRPMAGHQ